MVAYTKQQTSYTHNSFLYKMFTLFNWLKVDLGLAGEDCQHAVTNESLCTMTGCALETDVCHWMFKTKVNMVQGQEDGYKCDLSRNYVIYGKS